MKFSFLIGLCFLFSSTVLAQDMGFAVRSTSFKQVKKEHLISAKTMKDINPGYPSSWIQDEEYISTHIKTIYKGEIHEAIGSNEVLNEAQVNLLSKMDMGSNIDFEVKYKKINSVTGIVEDRLMEFTYTLIPAKEASFVGGAEKMDAYFKKEIINKMPLIKADQLQIAMVIFTINEKGEVINPRISESSKDKEIDLILLRAIQQMPAWKPAENASQIKIKQNFEFSVGNLLGC